MVITAAHITPLVALVAGILILIMPRLLNIIVAVYLIIVGLTGLNRSNDDPWSNRALKAPVRR